MSPRVGLVVVSHSRPLAEAAVALAIQMVADDPPPIAVAAGTEDGGIGTDAMAVLSGIEEVASSAGVLVLMDLGSAVLSTEMALEFLGEVDYRVELTGAPLVEGLVAAVVQASLGSDLDTVRSEAAAALDAKHDQVGDRAEVALSGAEPTPVEDRTEDPADAVSDVVLVNEQGLHARPAAALVRVAAGHDARLEVVNLSTGAGPAAATSLSGVARLGARHGHRLQLAAWGPDAQAAVDAVGELVRDGFGEPVAPVPAGEDAATRDGDGRDEVPPAARPRPAWATSAPSAVVGISPGRAVGPVARLEVAVTVAPPADVLDESAREPAIAALVAAADEVASTLEAHAATVDDDHTAAILSATAMMARDPELLAAAGDRVRDDGTHPAKAVIEAANEVVEAFAEAGGYLAERQVDVQDVRNRIVTRLLDQPMPGVPTRSDPFVLVADDLAPADTATLAGSNCVALVVRDGGPTSHTAIIARRLGIPAVVVGAAVDGLTDGQTVLVDGTAARLQVDPPQDDGGSTARSPTPVPDFDGRGRTSNGSPVSLLANVGGIDDVRAARSARAQGIGLLRTEFLFLERRAEPDHDEQVTAYRNLIEPFSAATVVVRTLDAGSDKPLPFLDDGPEPNPALGVRGLRTAWQHPGVLDRQLAAVAAAASTTDAQLRVMAPMVATPAEAAMFAAACAAHGLVAGVMVETPAAALSAEQLLDHVEFLSIGTNDLSQYTMAADRMAGAVAGLNDPWQPAVLALVEAVAKAGRARGKPVGVCGEAASDPALAVVLAGLGVTSLSMVPSALAPVALVLRDTDMARCRELAQLAVTAGSAEDARSRVRAGLPVLARHGL